MSGKKVTPAQVKKWAEAARDEWLARFQSEDAVRRFVHQQLDSGLSSVVAKALGFNNRWGNDWEVDHCNGRSGESILGDILREKFADFAAEWIERNLPLTPDFSKKEQAALVARARADYQEALRRAVHDAAVERASKACQAVLDEALAESLAPDSEEP